MTYKNYLHFTEFLLTARNFSFCICIFSTIIIKIDRFDYNITVHSMHFSSSHLSIRVSAFVFRFTCYLQAPFSISMLFTGSLFWFPCYSQAPFFPFSYYLQAPFLNLHVIRRFPFSIYMFFTGYLFPFSYYLQAPFFNLHVIYTLPFWISMLFTGSLFWFTCYLKYFGNLSALNLQKKVISQEIYRLFTAFAGTVYMSFTWS